MIDEDSKIIGYCLVANLISYITYLLVKNRCKLFPVTSDETDYNPRTEQSITQPSIIIGNGNNRTENDYGSINGIYCDSTVIDMDDIPHPIAEDLDDTISLSTLTVSTISETHVQHPSDIHRDVNGNIISIDEVDHVDKVSKIECAKL